MSLAAEVFSTDFVNVLSEVISMERVLSFTTEKEKGVATELTSYVIDGVCAGFLLSTPAFFLSC